MSCNSLPSATTTLSEAEFEQIALDWLHGLGCTVRHGPDFAPEMPTAERSGLFVLEQRLRRRPRPPHPHPPRRTGRQNRSALPTGPRRRQARLHPPLPPQRPPHRPRRPTPLPERPGRPLGRLSRARLPSSRHRAAIPPIPKIPKITVQTTTRYPLAQAPPLKTRNSKLKTSPQPIPKFPKITVQTVSPPSRRENIHATRTVPVLNNPDNPLPSRESRSRQPPLATITAHRLNQENLPLESVANGEPVLYTHKTVEQTPISSRLQLV